MRTKTTILNAFALAAFALCFFACKKSTPPTVTISNNISVTQTSANVTGEVTNEGSSSVTERGFIYGKQGESRQDTMYCGSGVGEFPTRLTGLEPNTTYNCSAFAKNDGGIGTSGKVTFTTRDHDLPIVTTSEVENVGTTTASCGGNVMDDGGAEVTERGVCWSTNHSPVATGSHATSGSGLGAFTCNMNNLAANTTYYVRAYAKNVKGVAYGEEKSFTTLDFDLPEVTTAEVTNITQTSAKGGGEVTSDGGTTVTERGICWSTNHNPTVSGNHANSGTGTGSFTCNITGLNAHTTYYVRAYATNSRGTAYGEEVSFNTSANPPTVSTGAVTNITTSSATGNGSIVSDGGNAVTERGFCWSTSHNPSITGTHVVAEGDANDFSAALTNLSSNTTYYVRAYATNGTGTAYGDEVQFTTLSISVPGVTTASVTNIGNTTATGGGNVISDGGATVTERGICWSTSHNPTISGSHANSGTGTGTFTLNMTNLTPNTTYYVKAYAINSQGTAYGEEVNFKTSQTSTYTVSVSANPNNGGTVAGGGTFQQGQSCTVRATAATGYNFQKWTENGSQVSTNANYTFTVNANRNLVANFQTGSYTISASANPSNGGTVSGAGNYNYNQTCTLTATPATGYTFAKWTKNGTQVSTNASYSFTVTASASYVAHFTANPQAPTGAINGLFSVSATQQVWFSQGNLQYKASTNTWRFATNQYDFVGGTDNDGYFYGNVSGSSNSNVSPTYSGWIDLFSWGTSGWNCGNTYYHPWDYDGLMGNEYLFGPPGPYDLTGAYAHSDWGVHNAIINGGNAPNLWRTMTAGEWYYVFNQRNTTSGIRFAKAVVNNVNGVILLPDDWNSPVYLYNTNQFGANYTSNVISISQWTTMQNAGAVFLPAAGVRSGVEGNHGVIVSNLDCCGSYWSVSVYDNYNAYEVQIRDDYLFPSGEMNRADGKSVRLVRIVQ